MVRGPPSEDEAGSDEKGGHSETAHDDGGGGEGPLFVPGGGGGESAPAAAEAKKEEKGELPDTKTRSAVAAKSTLPLAPRCLHRRCRRELPFSLLPLHRREELEEAGAPSLLLPLGPAAAGC